MGTIKAILKDYKDKDHQQQIVVEYRHKGDPRRFRLPTQFKTKAQNWNSKEGISKVDHALNAYLEKEISKIKSVRDKLTVMGIEPTCNEVLRGLQDLEDQQKKEKEKSLSEDEILNKPFLEWFDIHLASVSNTNTKKVQRIVRNHIAEFDKNVRLKDIDYAWLERFKAYLSGIVSSQNTIYTYLKRIGIVLGTVRKHARKYPKVKLHIQDIKEDLRDSKGVEKYDDPYGITFDQFETFRSFQIPSEKKYLESVRSWYVLGVSFGGLRYNDLFSLTEDNIKKDIFLVDGEKREVYLLNYYEQKNKKHHTDIVILPYAYPILKKYDGKLPPKKVRAVFSRQLKEIAKLLGWDYKVEIKKYNADGSIKDIEYHSFDSLFSSKHMRKTRVTIDEYLSIPENISRLATGHDSKARERYNVQSVASQLKGNEAHFKAFKKQVI